MGRETFVCECGQRYQTGATEWDHFGDNERSNRVGQTVGVGLLFSAMFSIVGLIAYLVLHFAFGFQKAAILTAMALAALPFVLMQITFWLGVVASIWRTRARKLERQ